MKAALKPLVDSGRLLLYQVHGETYGQIPSFLKWQKINRPSPHRANPKIEEGSRIPHGALKEDGLFQRRSSPLIPKNGAGSNPTLPKSSVEGKQANRSALSEGFVSPPDPLTLKVKLIKPLPTVEVVNAREEQLHPQQVVESSVMQHLQNQWKSGSEAEKVVSGWWSYYNQLGQTMGSWHTHPFENYRNQLLRVSMTNVDDEHMRLGIRFLFHCRRRRYMPNGDDLYQYPTTLFGRNEDSFEKVQGRINTLITEAVIWKGSLQGQVKAPDLVNTKELKQRERVAGRWLDWIIANSEEASELAAKSLHSDASAGARQRRMKEWYTELEQEVESGGGLGLCVHDLITQDITKELRKEIENESNEPLEQSSKRGENQQPESQPANGNEKSEASMDTPRV